MPPVDDNRPHDNSRNQNGRSGDQRVLADRYELLEEVGSGATATTYRALDSRLNRHVAVKILRPELTGDQTYVQRFEREARTAASVNHPNVVDIYDFGQQGASLYIVMQLIQGEDLKHLIQRRHGLDERRALEITQQVLRGLGAIHAAGIIHRDIKPQNVLIGHDGNARLADFGVAQIAFDMGLTTVGTTVGTAAYMAPEQAQAGTLSEATDIYSVGIMLYEMLTGELPFDEPSQMATMIAHIQQLPIAPSQRSPEREISAQVERVVMQAIAKAPEDRFRSARAMDRALGGVSSGDTVVTNRAITDRTVATQAVPVASRQAGSGAWPQTSAESSSARMHPSIPPSGAGRGLRNALGGLMVLALLVLAGVAGYLVYDYVQAGGNNNGGDSPTATAPAATVTDEPTKPAEGVNVPPESTSVPTETPTIVPTEQPTEVPTAVPTDPPTEPPTDVPTDAPTDPPIETPTVEPVNSGPTSPSIEPSDGDAAGNAPPQNPTTTEIRSSELATDGWSGAGVDVDGAKGVVVVGPGEEASTSFNLTDEPGSDTFSINLMGVTAGTAELTFGFLVNGQDAGTVTSTLPAFEDGQQIEYGTMAVRAPTALLKRGKNSLTIINNSASAMALGWQPDDKEDKKKKNDPGNDPGDQTLRVERGSLIVTNMTIDVEVVTG